MHRRLNLDQINGNLQWYIHVLALHPTDSRSNWNLEILVFVEGGKLDNPAKDIRSMDKNQQRKTQPTYGVNSEYESGPQ